MHTNRVLLLTSIACGTCCANLLVSAATPETPKKPVTDDYQGVKVQDDYQWLENDSDPAVKSWSDEQNQQTRGYLDKLPDRAAVEKQLTEWYARTSPSYTELTSRSGVLFALKF